MKNRSADVADQISQMRAEAEKKLIRQENLIVLSKGLRSEPSGLDLNRLLVHGRKNLQRHAAPFWGEDSAVLVGEQEIPENPWLTQI